jgi:hypothetical protein
MQRGTCGGALEATTQEQQQQVVRYTDGVIELEDHGELAERGEDDKLECDKRAHDSALSRRPTRYLFALWLLACEPPLPLPPYLCGRGPPLPRRGSWTTCPMVTVVRAPLLDEFLGRNQNRCGSG